MLSVLLTIYLVKTTISFSQCCKQNNNIIFSLKCNETSTRPVPFGVDLQMNGFK